MRLPVNHLAPLVALILLSACGSNSGRPKFVASAPENGPAADYPVSVGEPFTIGAVTYTPADTLNYDAVGYAAVASAPSGKVAGAHKTLPLPSYVEVTHLDTGKTVLLRLDARGPMRNDLLIELTPAAAAQLGLVAGNTAPVRVRRVNPPEPERAVLRRGEKAPERMETPQPLLNVLKRKLASQEGLIARPAAPPITTLDPDAGRSQEVPPPPALTEPPTPFRPAVQPVPAKPAVPVTGDRIVQVAAFSTRERADRAAAPLGATVTKPGQYWYVRLGPFATAADAEAGLAKARAAGYSDARIQYAD